MAMDLYQCVEQALGLRATKVRSLSGGCVAEVFAVSLEDDSRVVLKRDQRPQAKLDVEGYMLRYLAHHSALPVPSLRHSEASLLIMDHIEGASRFSSKAEKNAASLLAQLHAIKADQFGLDRPTLIGGLHQPNTQSDSWIDFFRHHRLLYMAEEALRLANMPHSLYARLQTFADRLDDFLDEPPHPSLLHGDVWTTNVLADQKKITAFIDPAIYYGHPEIELAFITLFGSFGESFFKAYQELQPIRPGFFEVRREIYNLYPLLVHTCLFGSSYLSGVEGCLARHGF